MFGMKTFISYQVRLLWHITTLHTYSLDEQRTPVVYKFALNLHVLPIHVPEFYTKLSDSLLSQCGTEFFGSGCNLSPRGFQLPTFRGGLC